ncbi:MAG: hypothetical protein AAF456_00125 [Planctomycetota bacterium]
MPRINPENILKTALMAAALFVLPLSSAAPVRALCQERQPVPGRAEIRETLDLIKELFESNYESRTFEGQRELSALLLENGRESTGVEQYVLLTESIRIASRAVSPDTAVEAIELLETGFSVNSIELRTDYLKSAAENIATSEQLEAVTRNADAWIESAVDNDAYDAAEDVLLALAQVARKTNSPLLAGITDDRLKNCRMLGREYRRLASSLEKIAADQDDEEANRRVGEFYLFEKGDFESGLPFVARSDSPVAAVAQQELERSSAENADEAVILADQWWELADNNIHVMKHAADIYRSAIENTSGLTERKLLQRIDDYQTAMLQSFNGDVTHAIGPVWNVIWQDGTPEWQRVAFYPDGSLQILNSGREFQNTFMIESGVIRWTSWEGSFVFVVQLEGTTLRFQKFDSKSGELLDQGTATAVTPGR